VLDGVYVPDAFVAFTTCRGSKPWRAEDYKRWEEQGDWERLKNNKGVFGHDKYYFRYSTPVREEFERVSPLYMEGENSEVLFVDRERRVVVTKVDGSSVFRQYTGRPDNTVRMQMGPCFCDGCKNDVACMHPEMSGLRKELRMERYEEKVAMVISCTERRAGGESAVVERKMVQTRLDSTESGKVQFTNEDAKSRTVGIRSVVVFKREGGWGAGVVQGEVLGEFTVLVLLAKGGGEEKSVEEVVKWGDIMRASVSRPSSSVVSLSLTQVNIERADQLCI